MPDSKSFPVIFFPQSAQAVLSLGITAHDLRDPGMTHAGRSSDDTEAVRFPRLPKFPLPTSLGSHTPLGSLGQSL